jgi:copper(I)-binding protein
VLRIVGAVLTILLAQTALAEVPRIEQAWLREPAPGQGALAIYLRLVNPGPSPRVLQGARVDGAASAALHMHETVDGMMRMRPAGPVEVAAGADLLLAPGGYHLMVFDVQPLPRAGARLPFCLLFADGEQACAEATVRDSGG